MWAQVHAKSSVTDPWTQISKCTLSTSCLSRKGFVRINHLVEFAKSGFGCPMRMKLQCAAVWAVKSNVLHRACASFSQARGRLQPSCFLCLVRSTLMDLERHCRPPKPAPRLLYISLLARSCAWSLVMARSSASVMKAFCFGLSQAGEWEVRPS